MTITTIDGSAGGTILDQAGSDFIQLGPTAATVMASLGTDTIFGDEGSALIDATGNPNAVQIQPGLGTETVIGGTGPLTIVGTDGWESVSFAGLPGHIYILTNIPGTLATIVSDGSGTDSVLGGALVYTQDGATWPQPFTLSIAPLNAVQPEGSGTTPFTFTVTRSGDVSTAGTVDWAVTGSGANPANATDFSGGVLPSGKVSFAAGQATATITVNVAGDTLVGPDDGFTVTLVNPSAGGTLGTASATGTIIDNNTSISIAPLNAVQPEGSVAAVPFTFTVTRSGDVSTAGTVDWAVTGSGANPANATDFSGGVLPSGTVSFAAGQTTATITVNVIGDTVVGPNDGFAVTLANPSGIATLGTASATGTIIDNNTSISIAPLNATQPEGSGVAAVPFTFTVTRSGDVSTAGTVDWAVTGSGANPANATDFSGGVLPSGTVSFAAGQTTATITVNVIGDTVVGPNDSFAVTLANPSGIATLGTASATGTIVDNNVAPGSPPTPPDPLAGAIDSPFHAPLSAALTNLIGGSWASSWTKILPFAPGATPPSAPTGFVDALSVPGGAVGSIAIPAAAKMVFNTAAAPVTLTGAVLGDFIVNEGGNVATTVTGGVFVDAQQPATTPGNEAVTALANSVVFTGAGNDTIRAPSGNNSLEGGTGNNLFVLGTGLNLVFSAGQDTIQAGNGNATVTGADTTPAAPDILIQGGRGTLNFLNGGGQATVIGGRGAVTADGGLGGGSFTGSSRGNNLLTTGAEATTLIGGGGGDILVANNAFADVLTAAGRGNATLDGSAGSGNNVFTGGSGNTIILTGAGNDTVAGGNGHATISGSAGNDMIGAGAKGGTIVVGSGNDTITAGRGADLITFVNGQAGGEDLLVAFSTRKDHIMLRGYGSSAITDALATAQTVTGGVSLTLSDHTVVTLTGVSLSQLSASSFQLS